MPGQNRFQTIFGLKLPFPDKCSVLKKHIPQSLRITDDRETCTVAMAFGLFWFIWWSILPIISLDNAFIDVLENIVWGRHFQFGYDKNPYLGAWVSRALYDLTGSSLWIFYFLSQVFVMAGFASVWVLARRMTNNSQSALVGTMLLCSITFYGMKAAEFCDDVMELGIWPLLILFFHKALKDEAKIVNWLLVGLFAGLAFMTKYYGAILFASMAAVVLFTPEGRRSFRQPGIYLAAVVFAAISLPNILWLTGNDMVAVSYAFERAQLTSAGDFYKLMNHIENPWEVIERLAGVLAVPAAVFFIIFIKRTRTLKTYPSFDSFFLNVICWGPIALTIAFSFVTGASINYSWVIPCFPLFVLFLAVKFQPEYNKLNMRLMTLTIVIITIVFGVIFSVRSLNHQGYKKRGCDYENYPGKAVSAKVTAKWNAEFGTPLKYVVGERIESCNVSVYSKDAPEAYFSGNAALSQWINEDDIRKHGAVMVWKGTEAQAPEWASKVCPESPRTPVVTEDYPRAVPGWFKALKGREPKTIQVSYRFIKPAVK